MAGDAGRDAASLHRWLQGEVPPAAELGFARSADPEHQGALLDVLSLVLSSAFSGMGLAVAIAQWRRSRPTAGAVTITYRAPDGSVTTIDAADAASLDAVVRALEQQS